MSTYMRRGNGKATLFPDAQVSALQALGWVALTAHLIAPPAVKMLAVGNNIYPVNQDGTFYADPADVLRLLSQGASVASGATTVYMRRITGEGVAVPSAEETAQQSIGWTALTTQLAAPSGTKVMEVNGNVYPVGPDGTLWADPADVAALTSQGAATVAVTAATVAPYVITFSSNPITFNGAYVTF